MALEESPASSGVPPVTAFQPGWWAFLSPPSSSRCPPPLPLHASLGAPPPRPAPECWRPRGLAQPLSPTRADSSPVSASLTVSSFHLLLCVTAARRPSAPETQRNHTWAHASRVHHLPPGPTRPACTTSRRGHGFAASVCSSLAHPPRAHSSTASGSVPRATAL